MRVRHSGFTLIELMMSVGIVGILASVAVPSFARMQLRSKAAERNIMTTAIDRSVDDVFSRDLKYPDDGGSGRTTITLNYNPALPPQAHKRQFLMGAAGWNRLNLLVEGGLYYSYYGYGYFEPPGTHYYYTWSYGDLDGNGDWSTCYAYHIRWWAGTRLSSETYYDTTRINGPTFGCF